MVITLYDGPRSALLPLFAEADDSESQIAGYIELGDVLVATETGGFIGHAQIIETAEPETFELKSLAVAASRRSGGIGAALVQAVLAYCRHRNARSLVVATAAASIPALKFYQRQGFRISHVIRDFYSPKRGYRPLELDGIPLRDEVILYMVLREASTA
jgi:ribosomal protein S18 acetylase RimI-like enzyme